MTTRPSNPGIKEYVAGFLFDSPYNEIVPRRVVLIRKLKPAFQAGKLNAVGGKIEAGEPIDIAMAREFKEETGAEVESPWTLFAILNGQNSEGLWRVFFFVSITVQDLRAMVSQQEEEEIVIPRVKDVQSFDRMENLDYLIPMALLARTGKYWCKVHEITER